MMDAIIAKLESKGFNRWTKGKYDRLYVNASTLGLSCTYHRTGSEDVSTFNGEAISNSEARRMKSTKCYIDVESGEVVCDNDMMREAAEAILAECEEPEVEEASDDVEADAEENNERDAIVAATDRDIAEVGKQAAAKHAPAAIVEQTTHRLNLIRDYFASCPIADIRLISAGANYKNVGVSIGIIKFAMSSHAEKHMRDADMFTKLVNALKA